MSEPSEHAPNGTVVKAIAPDGTETIITDWVGAIYDLVIGSLDFGSGFLTVEDAVPLASLAELLGYPANNEATRYLEQARKEEAAEEAKHRGDCEQGRHHYAMYGDRTVCAFCGAAMT